METMVSTRSRMIRAARLCHARLKSERRDPLPLAAVCVILLIIGDDLAIWAVNLAAPAVAAILTGWGATTTTLVFGVAPALLLAVLVLLPEWRESWRATAD